MPCICYMHSGTFPTNCSQQSTPVRKVCSWGILLLSFFWLRTFLRIFGFIEIFCFLVIFWLWITSASSPVSAIVEEIGNISKVVVGMHSSFSMWIGQFEFLSSSLFSLFLFCSSFLEQAFLPPDFQKHFFYCCYQYAKSSDCPRCISGGERVKVMLCLSTF